MNCIGNPEGVKWDLGLTGFCPGKMGFKPLGLIWSVEMGKNVKNQKWEWHLSIAKRDFENKWLGNGSGIGPPSGP